MRFVVCLLAAVAISSSWALPQYRAEEVMAPSNSVFFGMNADGTLVGWMDSATNNKGLIRHADGEIVIVEPPPGFEGYEVDFTDINDAGQISGTLVHGFNGTGKGFVYTETGGFQIMNSAPTEAIATSSMTNDGLMAFTFSGGSGLWNPETNAFIHIPRYGLSAAVAGDLATGQNWRWHNGTMTELQGVGVVFSTSIAADGFGSGSLIQNGRNVATIWNGDGSIFFSDPSSNFTSSFQQITSGNIAVGGRRYSDDRFVGTIFSPATGVVDVNTLIAQQDFVGTVQGMHLIEANGFAMGRRLVGDELRHVLLTPVPEPGTMLALGAGLAALLRCRKPT